MEFFGGGCGAEIAVVGAGEGVVIGGIFAGDDDGGGGDAVLQGVEAGDGLALDGAGSRARAESGVLAYLPDVAERELKVMPSRRVEREPRAVQPNLIPAVALS